MSNLSSSWFLLLAAFLVCSFAMLTAAGNEIYENRGVKSGNGGEETRPDKRQFFVGSRYGRSQSDLTNMDENGKTSANRIVPRNDRFFFGSRYGKRSPPVAAIDSDHNDMTCFYTGVTNLFRCVESQKMDLQLNTDDDK